MFGLERSQGRHNGVISNIGNSSASNDPHQIPNDSTEILLKGAAKAAAGKELGLEEEQVLAAVSRQFTRDRQRAAYANRNQSLADWEQKSKTLVDEGFEVQKEESDVLYDGAETEIDRAFGYEQSDLQNYLVDDREFEAGEGGELVRKAYETTAEPVASKSALRDALATLRSGTSQYGYDMFPGSADVEGRLETHLSGGFDRAAEASLARDIVQRDSARFDPEVRQYNDFQSAAEADNIARDSYTVNGPGAMADEAIGRIAEIRKLGGAGALAAGEMAQTVRYSDGSDIGNAVLRNGTFFDPNTNNPIAIQGPETPAVFQGANTPNTQQVVNAPAPQNAATWMQANLPQAREGGRVFNDYPQVDITTATTNFAQKLRELDGFGLGNISENIRSPQELDRVISFIANKARETGKPLYLRDEESGTNRRSANPGAQEVMQLLRMSPGEQEQLANALYQVEMSQDPTAYRARTQGPTQGVNFDAQEAINGKMGQVPVARIPGGSTIRMDDGSRRTIVTELAGLEGTDAQKPFMAQVQGESPRINRRKPGNMGSGDELAARIEMQARARAKGKPMDEKRVRANIVKARLAEERAKRDDRVRAERKRDITIPSLGPEDNAFIDSNRERISRGAEQSEVQKLIDLAAFGRQSAVPAERPGSPFGEGAPVGSGVLDLIVDENDPRFRSSGRQFGRQGR